jgi:trans-2-enoyl-CoA reductase
VKKRVLVLGAGFGGLELSTMLSEAFGEGIDVNFFSNPTPTGTYHEPSVELRADKEHFGSSRRARWFGL